MSCITALEIFRLEDKEILPFLNEQFKSGRTLSFKAKELLSVRGIKY